MNLLERADLLAALAQCPPGRLVLVAGEAGIGKTSLVAAQVNGLPVDQITEVSVLDPYFYH